MEHVDYTYTVGMTDEEVADHLRTETSGVLSLARDGDAYALPVSYHYDGESLYLRLTEDGHSKKMAFLTATDEACFLLYDVEGEDSWSIVVTGGLRRLTAEEDGALAEAGVHAKFAPLRVFDEDIDDVEIAVYELATTAVTGRRTGRRL
ncbi:pyridoxamine 5'-phosphate oxidase family protein [Halomarina litorea]|uniref:pyridoxamine 5'-phosphate oxidase family protein n=1 Tax=Halomarina litorea TaxID=2961595 RepID=UPI0020C22CCD|nr:pyridoxamine 5'-phosphate oxidase family protein [Halomarina sp. BCD28]